MENATALDLANVDACYEFSKHAKSQEELALLLKTWMLQQIQAIEMEDYVRRFCLRAIDSVNWLSVSRSIDPRHRKWQ